MPFFAVGTEQRQVSTAANGSLSPPLPAGTQPSDIVLAIAVRDTQQPNDDYSMDWSISGSWDLVTTVVTATPGFETTGRVHLAVWAGRGWYSAPDISWTGTAQSDNSRIGDIAVCASYRPGSGLDVGTLATNQDSTLGTTNAYTFDTLDKDYVVGVHAFRPNNAPVSFVNANGFALNADFPGPTNFRPVLKLTQRSTPTIATYNAPTWGSPLMASQAILYRFPVTGGNDGIFVDGAVH